MPSEKYELEFGLCNFLENREGHLLSVPEVEIVLREK